MIMKIKVAKNQNELVGLLLLRKDVFVTEQKVDYQLEFDELDKTAIHIIIQENATVIATCRVLPYSDHYKIGRFAVEKNHRRLGLGSKLLQYIEEYAITHNISFLELGAQESAINFYQQNGFVINSDTFYDAGIPHKMMVKQLK